MKRLVLAAWLPAALLTLINAFEPPQLDDPFLYEIAQRIVSSPLDPYGFEIHWMQWPQPVHEELTPPVMPYWWAAALAIAPDLPPLWKLWLFPFALALSVAARSLAERLAPAAARAAPWVAALSPAVLTGFNLSQDVPALALSLAALALYLRAVERDSIGSSLVAGLVAGLALQTKYTAIGVVGAIALHALIERRYRPAAIAVPVALGLFAGWEGYTTLRYGSGMFAGQLAQSLFWVPRRAIVLPLVQAWGGSSPALLPAAAGLLFGSARAVVVGAASTAVLIVLALWSGAVAPLYLLLGLAALVAVATAARRAPRDRLTLWLVAWLLLEVGLTLAVSPFPAVRRILALSAVAWLLVARGWPRRAMAGIAIVALTAAVGLTMQAVDTLHARAERSAVAWSAEQLGRLDPSGAGSVRFVGHWGFQYHALRRGWRPLDPDHERLDPGDWVVVAAGVDAQQVRLPAGDARSVAGARWDARLPLATAHGFYGGGLPLSRARSRIGIEIYRVERSFVPESAWPARRLADWARRAVGRTAWQAGEALARELTHGDLQSRRWAVVGLLSLGQQAESWLPQLIAAADDPDAEVRWGVAEALVAFAERPAARRTLERLSADADPRVATLAREALRSAGAPG